MVQPANDPVTQEQENLNGQQAGEATPQYATLEQVRKLMEEEIPKAINPRISGLQSHQDKALNAVVLRQNQRLQQELDELKRNAGRAWVRDLPEEQQAVVRKVLEEVDAAKGQRQEAAEVEEPRASAPQADQASAQWEQVYGIVSGMGIDPKDPRMQAGYDILQDAGLTAQERQSRFLTVARGVIREDAVKEAQKPAPSPAKGEERRPAAPPVEGGQGRPVSFRNVDELRDAYLSDKITKKQYQEGLVRFGQPG